MDEWREKGKLLMDLVRLRTSPVAVKLLKDGEHIPKGVLRPVDNFGFPMAICQAVGMARRRGLTVGITPEESACPTSNIFFEWAELDDETDLANAWLKMGVYKNLEAAKNGIKLRPRFAKGECHGLIFSPLDLTKIVPDIILTYCDSAQAMALIGASCYKDGVGLTSFKPLQASGVCIEAIISVKVNGKPHLAIPCGGDRRLQGSGDDEVVFSIPSGRLNDVIEGLEARRRIGSASYPPPRNIEAKPEFNQHYEKLRKRMRPTQS